MTPLGSFLSSLKALIELCAGQQPQAGGSLEPEVHPWGLSPLQLSQRPAPLPAH